MLLQNTDELAKFSPPDRILFSKVLRAYNAKQKNEYTQLFEALSPQQQSDFIQYKAIMDRNNKPQPAVTTAYTASQVSSSSRLTDSDAQDVPKDTKDKRSGCGIC